MTTQLITIALPDLDNARELLSCFLSGRNPRTIEAYRTDLDDYCRFIGGVDFQTTFAQFIALSPGQANTTVLKYRSHLVERKLQASTINRRLAAIRSLVKLARTLGIVTWSLEIPNLKIETYRDTRGPGMSKFCEILALAENQGSAKAVRDVAILRLLFDLALRASELTGLDLVDFDADRSTVAVSAKGKSQKVLLTLPEVSRDAIVQWVAVRGTNPGALFLNFDRARKSIRLTRNGLYDLIRGFGSKVGIKTWPHGLRHLSITEACKVAQANGFGLEEILDHSRHASVTTLMVYRDRERNVQGQISQLISNKLERVKAD